MVSKHPNSTRSQWADFPRLARGHINARVIQPYFSFRYRVLMMMSEIRIYRQLAEGKDYVRCPAPCALFLPWAYQLNLEARDWWPTVSIVGHQG